MRVLTGAPAYDYLCSSYTPAQIWSLLQAADQQRFLIGCGTPGTGNDTMQLSNGLAMSHAYTIVGVFNLTGQNGQTVYQLI